MIKLVLLDFDGVIIDSYDLTIRYLQETFRHFNLPIPEKKTFSSLLGYKISDIFKKLLPSFTKEQLQPIIDYSMQMSLKYVWKIPLMPNARRVLRTLDKTYMLGLVTNRGKITTKLLIEKYSLSEFLDVIIDREDVQNHKPHPEPLLKALASLSTRADEAVYVGDTQIDFLAARNAKTRSIILSASRNLGDYQITSLRELPSLLTKINEQ